MYESTYLNRRQADADCEFIQGLNDGLTVIQELKTVLEEWRLDWNEVLERGQRDGLVQQLPVGCVREVTEDELVGVGHEVVFVQLITNVLRRHLINSQQETQLSLSGRSQ